MWLQSYLPDLGLSKDRACSWYTIIADFSGETRTLLGHFRWLLKQGCQQALGESDLQIIVTYWAPSHSLGTDHKKVKTHALGFRGWARRQEVTQWTQPYIFSDACCVPQSSALCPGSLRNIILLSPAPPPPHVHNFQSYISTQIQPPHIYTSEHSQNTGRGVPESWCWRWLCPSLILLYCLRPHQPVSTVQGPMQPCLELSTYTWKPVPTSSLAGSQMDV